MVRHPGMFRAEVIKENMLSGMIAIPPFIEWLIEQVIVVLAYASRLADTRLSVYPPISQGLQTLWFLSIEFVQGSCCQNFCIVFKMKLTVFDELLWAEC